MCNAFKDKFIWQKIKLNREKITVARNAFVGAPDIS